MPIDDGRDIRGTLSVFPTISVTKEDIDTLVNKVKGISSKEKKKENSFGSFFYDENGN